MAVQERLHERQGGLHTVQWLKTDLQWGQRREKRGYLLLWKLTSLLLTLLSHPLKPTWKRQAKHSRTEAQVLSDSVGTITTAASK